jgi:electron transfer flavoprotein alpha subunit
MGGVFVFSERPELASQLARWCKDLGKDVSVLAMSDPDLTDHGGPITAINFQRSSARVEDYSKGIADWLAERGAELFMVASTCSGREVAASVAAHLGCGMASDVLSLDLADGGIRVSRVLLGGALVKHELLPGVSVVTVATSALAPVEPGETRGLVEAVAVEADTRVRRISLEPTPRGSLDLTKAKRVITVGLGLDTKEDLALAEDLASVLGAELGCTRGVAEDRGWLPKSQYIGITGASVSPELYLSMGVSGQMQHVYGIRDAELVVAIDKNPQAPIFRVADYGIVGDLYDVVPRLTRALAEGQQ